MPNIHLSLLDEDNYNLYTANDNIASEDGDRALSLEYRTAKGNSLNEELIAQCSELFSNHYGKWSDAGPRPGQKIKLGFEKFKEIFSNNDISIAYCTKDNAIIGHAVYIRKEYSGIGYVSWVLQLVVHENYRKNGIATRLLNSIWGFSNDTAWGLATVNPLTVKTLEKATLRKCDPRSIKKYRDIIETIQNDVFFAQNKPIEVTTKSSLIHTEFFIDFAEFINLITAYKANGNPWKLGELKPGYEWLAFTFKHQKTTLIGDYLDEMIQNSEATLKDAYSRMDFENQAWAQHAPSEVEFILSTINPHNDIFIIDIGCGEGRHIFKFAEYGFRCLGIDFSEVHIAKARQKAAKKFILNSTDFKCTDARHFVAEDKADVILLLYDVVGSFAKDADNELLINNAHKSLKDGGFLVLSVMNMELTESIAHYKVDDISRDIETLVNLKASDIMQKTGNIFNPEYFILENKTKLVYRKEQFINDGHLSSEYIVRDRRYTMAEMTDILQRHGFNIVDSRYVQAGKFEIPLDPTANNAKELLFICKK